MTLHQNLTITLTLCIAQIKTWCLPASGRAKHREEVARLRTELGSMQSSSKGGQQAVDRTKKDLDKTRHALQCLRHDAFETLHWPCLW